jgi:hypothetical protein
MDRERGCESLTGGQVVDNFSARWTRTANFASGAYHFFGAGDDGVKLYVFSQTADGRSEVIDRCLGTNFSSPSLKVFLRPVMKPHTKQRIRLVDHLE